MHHITVDNCRIIGAIMVLPSYGNTANSDQHNFVITNNTIEDVYYQGVYMLYTDTALIEGNDVSRPTKTSVTTMYGYFISAGTQNAILMPIQFITLMELLALKQGQYMPLCCCRCNSWK